MSTVIIALDFPNQAKVKSFLEAFKGERLFVKVGMELYYQEGPSIIQLIQSYGHQIFLDLKLHDIPNTVEKAMEGLAKLGVDMVNVHAAGGQAMMEAALRGLATGTPNGKTRPKLIAVTQLTSTSEADMRSQQLIEVTLLESVVHYAQVAQAARVDGVVCSALEAKAIEEACGPAFLKVTPGIRLASSDVQDQKRVTTPALAKQLGATHIVVGRPITQDENPVEAYHMILNQWEDAQ